LLILSQVILSLQLPFAVIPLIHFTSDRNKMGEFANPWWVKILAWMSALVIVGLNIYLVTYTMTQWLAKAGGSGVWIEIVIIPVVLALAGLLLYLTFGPFLRQWYKHTETAEPTFSTADLATPSFARIGVALEATSRDRAILAQAIPLARQHEAELVLIHVAEGMGPRFWKSESQDAEGRSDRAYLDRLQQEIAALGLHVDAQLGYGEPSNEIVWLAEELHLNLLVLGTHGHRFPMDILAGATATRVRHKLRIPVFMVRTDTKKN
jgi:manganese transport protein